MSNQVAGVPGLDPTLPDVSLIIGGQERHLVFCFNAIALVDKLTGINLLKAIVAEPSAHTLRALLWAALLKENPTLTIEEVGSWINMRNITTIHEALVMTWFGSSQQAEEADSSGEVKAQATATV